MDYKAAFKNREEQYENTVEEHDGVLRQEFQTAIDTLDLKLGETLVNIPSGGNPLYKYINPSLNIHYIPFEPLKDHSEFSNIPLSSNSIDKIITLASFHHVQEEREDTLREFHRILQPGGMLVIADVIDGTKQAYWLNGFVNDYNPNGHKGLFLTNSDVTLAENTGFKVEYCTHTYDWSFKSDEQAVNFTKNLFGLNLLHNDTLLLQALKDILDFKDCKFEWQLMYMKCTKTDSSCP